MLGLGGMGGGILGDVSLFALRWFLGGHVVCGCPVELRRYTLPKSLVIFVSGLKFVNTGTRQYYKFLDSKNDRYRSLRKDNHFVEA